MTPGPLARALAVVYGVVDAAVVVAPAVAVRATGARAGIEGEYDLDLLVASAVIGVVHGVVSWRRLVDEERMAERAVDVWVAALDALVVLAAASTWLVAGVLLGFTDVHALLAQRGAPVVLLWAGVQLVAVVLAEVTGRGVYRWLEPRAHAAPDVEVPEVEVAAGAATPAADGPAPTPAPVVAAAGEAVVPAPEALAVDGLSSPRRPPA